MAMAVLADNATYTIVIEAGAMTKTVVGHTAIGALIEEVTLTHRVSHADLDLATHSGAIELKQRVKDTARLACEQLDKLYPLEEEEAPCCIRQVVEHASIQVDDAIATAEQQAKDKVRQATRAEQGRTERVPPDSAPFRVPER